MISDEGWSWSGRAPLDPRSIPLDEYFFQTIPSICNSYYRKFLGFLAKPKQDSKNWTKDAFSAHLFAPRHSSTTSGTRITRDDPPSFSIEPFETTIHHSPQSTLSGEFIRKLGRVPLHSTLLVSGFHCTDSQRLSMW